MKCFVSILSRASIFVLAISILACVEIENDFGKLKMPGDLFATGNGSIDELFWHESNIYYLTHLTADRFVYSLISVDVLTKETKIVVPSLPLIPSIFQPQCWINDNFFYYAYDDESNPNSFKAELIRCDLTGITGNVSLGTINSLSFPIIHQNNLLAFNRGVYDPQAGGSPIYLRDEKTAQEEKIGVGDPLAISPDGLTVLFRTGKDQTFMFYDVATKNTTEADFNLPDNGVNHQFYWRKDGLYSINENVLGRGIITDLSTSTQLGSLFGDLDYVRNYFSPYSSKVIVESSDCSLCNHSWSLSSFQLTKSTEMISGRFPINNIVFSPDETSIAFLVGHEIYTLKIQ